MYLQVLVLMLVPWFRIRSAAHCGLCAQSYVLVKVEKQAGIEQNTAWKRYLERDQHRFSSFVVSLRGPVEIGLCLSILKNLACPSWSVGMGPEFGCISRSLGIVKAGVQ
jgi:hypothetical protein